MDHTKGRGNLDLGLKRGAVPQSWHGICMIREQEIRTSIRREDAMPNEFTVVGEHRDIQSTLLVVGADGQYYQYDLAHDRVVATEVDDRWWLFASEEQAS
jgi:hypothetical protein